jgi:hypothetical protein
MPKYTLDRAVLARFLPDPQSIATFEALMKSVGMVGTLGAQDAAHVAITGGTASLDPGAVGTPSLRLGDDTSGFYRPAADQIALAIAGAQLLLASVGLLKVTGDVQATGQLKSTVATGTAPLSVASTTQVPNLYASRAALADTATNANGLTSPTTFPANATDLATCITLANALKAAAITKGL